jgi:hypothetical protein
MTHWFGSLYDFGAFVLGAFVFGVVFTWGQRVGGKLP